jgi:hypothetical protein
MNRLDFFKRLFAGGVAVFTAKYAGAALLEGEKHIYLESVYIAGFQYYKGVEIEKDLQEKDLLDLKRQAENQHDHFAVEVYRGEHKLGYLPRSENKIIARMMDQDVNMKAIIRSIDPEASPFRRVKIGVYSEMR